MKTSKHVLLSLVLCCAHFLSFSQPFTINETFDQMNLFSSKDWRGDVTKFSHQDDQMVSASIIVNDHFYVCHSLAKSDSYEFSIDVNLAFATSSANYVDLFLSANDSNIISANQTLILRIGDTRDEIKLVSSIDGEEQTLIQSPEKITHSFDGTITIKYAEDTLVVWVHEQPNGILWSDTATDVILDSAFFIGLAVKQSTSSFHQKHRFDNWYVGPERRDTSAPIISDYHIRKDSTVLLVFNEPIDSTKVSKASFTFLQPLIKPIDVNVNGDSVFVFYDYHFSSGIYSMQVSQIEDRYGNTLLDTIIQTFYREIKQASYRDVILTEIMCDPSPSVKLPEYEYIEIANRSSSYIDLSGWKLHDATKYCAFGTYILPPDSFLIICDDKVAPFFKTDGSVMGVSNFVSLNNSSDSLTLYNAEGTLIDFVFYQNDWHSDEWKKNGGWSLEIQNSTTTCTYDGNWISSVSSTGGTPGHKNSVASSFNDEEVPQLLNIRIEETNLLLDFNESIETYSPQTSDFVSDLEITTIKNVATNTIQLTFAETLSVGQAHSIRIKGVHDCTGNIIDEQTVVFGIPSIPKQGDLVINEVMFEPSLNSVEYVELYNASKSLFDLSNIHIGEPIDEYSWQSLKRISEGNSFIEPESFRVVTNNCDQLSKNYPNMDRGNCIQTQNIHQLSNEFGSIGIAFDNGTPIDMFFYTSDFHFPLLTETKGVSLERRSYADSTNSSSNWTSASASKNYGTPGNLNSQFIGLQTDNESHLRYDPISPNGDGFNDALVIENNTMEPNTVVDVQIFDVEGRLIAYPFNKNIVGYRNQFVWEGINDDGSLIREGIYIVLLKSFTPQNGELIFRAPFTVTN